MFLDVHVCAVWVCVMYLGIMSQQPTSLSLFSPRLLNEEKDKMYTHKIIVSLQAKQRANPAKPWTWMSSLLNCEGSFGC